MRFEEIEDLLRELERRGVPAPELQAAWGRRWVHRIDRTLASARRSASEANWHGHLAEAAVCLLEAEKLTEIANDQRLELEQRAQKLVTELRDRLW